MDIIVEIINPVEFELAFYLVANLENLSEGEIQGVKGLLYNLSTY